MADTYTKFHYRFTQNNTISGRAVLRQTEDAINDLGQTVNTYSSEFSGDVADALRIANQALDTANTASENASEALTTAQQAVSAVNTLQIQVNSWDATIQDALTRATTAVTQSTQAVESANQAVATAQDANSTAEEALTVANNALTQAQQAVESANDAVDKADKAQNAAEEAERIAEELAKSCYCWRIYDGEVTPNSEIAVEDVTPSGNVKVGDLIVGTNGLIYEIVSVSEDGTTLTVGSEWFTIAPFITYSAYQDLTDEQRAQARQNLGIINAETEYTFAEDLDLDECDYYARYHVPNNTANAPTEDAYFVDIDINNVEPEVIRQLAVMYNSSEVYIRWGLLPQPDDENDEDIKVEWTAWQQISGGGGSSSVTMNTVDTGDSGFEANTQIEIDPYTLGTHAVTVYADGLLLTEGEEWSEVDSTHIELLDAVRSNTKIVIYIKG